MSYSKVVYKTKTCVTLPTALVDYTIKAFAPSPARR